jgi:outer membrane protein OmpA-like peptidoglycan-associated protein
MNIRLTIAAGCLLAGAAFAGDRPGVLATLDNVSSNWPDAALKARVIGEKEGQILIGSDVSFGYEAGVAGYAAIVHVSSHGEMTLARGGQKGANKQGQTETFATSEPLGTETVYVLFSDAPLDAVFDGKSAVELGDTRDAAEKFTARLTELMGKQKLATARLQYLLIAKAGLSEHTTRGIVRKVQEMDEEPETVTAAGASSRAIDEPIEFALNSVELTPDSKLKLDLFGEAMLNKDMSGRSVALAGHTDNSGEEDYNCGLSMRRADAARNYLVKSFGIKGERILVAGFGESQPVVPNDTDASRQKNRRVAFTFSKPDEKSAPVSQGCARR